MNKEELVHKAVCRYIKVQYPGVIFTSDASGIRVSMGLAKKLKAMRSAHKIPDLIILEANSKYHGLIIEIKHDRSIYKKDGTLKKNEHVEEQQKTLRHLEAKGYCARFGCGFDECIALIDWYMKIK